MKFLTSLQIISLALSCAVAVNDVPPKIVQFSKATQEETAAPVETTAAPAETTAAPVETTAAPVETTAAPVETTATTLPELQPVVDATAGMTEEEADAYHTAMNDADDLVAGGASIAGHETAQGQAYSKWKIALDRWDSNQKALKAKKLTNVQDLINQMETAADADTYYQAMNVWKDIMDVYQGEGCLPPPPPAVLHEERPSIERQCHKGYKVGFSEAEAWVKLVWEDADEPSTLEEEKLKAWRDKIKHYTRCLILWFSSKHSVFHICGRKGMEEGIKHFFDLYFVKGEHAVSDFEKYKAKYKQAEGYFQARYADVVKRATPQYCTERFPMNTNVIGTKGEGRQKCGGPQGLYCSSPQFPVCNVEVGECRAAHNEVKPITSTGGADQIKPDWRVKCKCANGEIYQAACYDNECSNVACENGHKEGNVSPVNPSDPTTLGNYVVCAPILNTSLNQRNIFTRSAPVSAALDEPEINPYSMNEIHMECLRFLPEARKWLEDENVWFEYDTAESEADQHKYLDHIQDAYVTQVHGPSAWEVSQKSLVYVLEAQCHCGDKSYRVYDVAPLADFNGLIGANGYNDKGGPDGGMSEALRGQCGKLEGQCSNGHLDIASCGQGQARWTSRKIVIDAENRDCYV